MNFGMFRRKSDKWREVRWRNGARHVYLALRFATDVADGGDRVSYPPTIEKTIAESGPPESAPDEALIIREVQSAVAEYNRMNLCALRVAGIRYGSIGGAVPIDYGTATRKLLNLL